MPIFTALSFCLVDDALFGRAVRVAEDPSFVIPEEEVAVILAYDVFR